MLLQTGGTPAAVAGTLVLLSLYFSVTAHLAARNVLGSVPPRSAIAVGPFPAVVAVVGVMMAVSPAVTIPAAVVVDALAIRYVYEQDLRLSAYITFIHVVVTILLGVVIGGITLLLAVRP